MLYANCVSTLLPGVGGSDLVALTFCDVGLLEGAGAALAAGGAAFAGAFAAAAPFAGAGFAGAFLASAAAAGFLAAAGAGVVAGAFLALSSFGAGLAAAFFGIKGASLAIDVLAILLFFFSVLTGDLVAPLIGGSYMSLILKLEDR